MNLSKTWILVSLMMLLSGCATPYAQFYQDRTGGVDITKSDSVILNPGEPKLIRGGNQEDDYLKMLESGYSLVGISSFNASEANERGAIAQAKKVHATVVLTYSKHTGTTSGVMPLTLPDTRVSTTNMMGTAYGSSGGYANYSGMATTTTYGTKTTYIPYTVNRSDYFASYWIKNKPPIFGVHIKAMSQDEVQQIGSNKGLVVNAVVKGSPAFDVDIIKGDVISKIGDFYVYDGETYQHAVRTNQGFETLVVLFRNGQEISKLVKLRNRELSF